ncbi:hypothetical protein HYX00_01175 [Candidatus Woesearchaeota archaeon]|nr:hypothetical protein [Candidatus Woesearchaeota archaeon]
MKVNLRIDKNCKGNVCPIPVNLLPNVKKEIKNVKTKDNSGRVEIEYDENKISKRDLIGMLKKIGYNVKEG